MSTLVLIPLEPEFRAFLEELAKLGHLHQFEKIEEMRLARVPSLGLICAVGGHGKVQFALQAQRLLQRFEIQRFFCIGSAGSLSAEVVPLDIVVAEKTVEHDFKMKIFKKDMPSFEGNKDLLAKIMKIEALSIKAGIIASGDEDIVTKFEAETLHERTKALAVAWEGAGAARAAKMANVAFLEIRAITDSCSESSLEHFKANLQPAMRNLARLFSQFQ